MKTKFNYFFIVVALLAGIYSIPAQTNSVGIASSGNQMVLFWPTTVTNWVLQSTTNLSSSNWVAVSNAVPVTAVTVTNASPAMFFRLNLGLANTSGMALIPAGTFTMGDTLDGESDAVPTNVFVSAFYMDTNLVTYSQWQTVLAWAVGNGYVFVNFGSGKSTNHPLQSVDWYDAVKWCNARSQMAGLTPVYYANTNLTQVYGMSSPEEVPYVNWGANGYRLPTEAEWEKAARGGFSGLRFPWLVLTNINTISESQANYYACMTCQTYDLGPYNGDNTNFDTGAVPYTSQVGDFAANGYGLYDMAGNIQEWCWDWHGTPPYQAGSPYLGGSDPYGPATGTQRITRGGDWDSGPSVARCANRDYFGPTTAIDEIGFRCVRGF